MGLTLFINWGIKPFTMYRHLQRSFSGRCFSPSSVRTRWIT